MTYKEKLRDPRWQKKRLEILNRDNFTCKLCGCNSDELHIHHIKYKGYVNPWDYEDAELITHCKNCHFITEKLAEENLVPIVIERKPIKGEKCIIFTCIYISNDLCFSNTFIYDNETKVMTSLFTASEIYINAVIKLIDLAKKLV